MLVFGLSGSALVVLVDQLQTFQSSTSAGLESGKLAGPQVPHKRASVGRFHQELCPGLQQLGCGGCFAGLALGTFPVFAWSRLASSFKLNVGWLCCCCFETFACSSGFNIQLFIWWLVAVETVKRLNTIFTVWFSYLP